MRCYQRVRILRTLSGYWVIFLQKRNLWVLLNVFDCRTLIAVMLNRGTLLAFLSNYALLSKGANTPYSFGLLGNISPKT